MFDEADAIPVCSYVALIATVLQECPEKKMTLAEIYKAITTKWPFYRKKDAQWQNSIRHNLSLNECFKKIPKEGSQNKKVRPSTSPHLITSPTSLPPSLLPFSLKLLFYEVHMNFIDFN